jgi:hypothetical protein
MRTNDLIEQLATDLRPMPKSAGFARLLTGPVVGGAVALGLVLVLLGPRKDFSDAMLTSPFWIKWVYVLVVTSVAFWLCKRFARPEPASGNLFLALTIPLLALAALGFLELSAVPSDQRVSLWLGMSARKCPWIIAALSLPVFAGVLWAFRRFAPTQQRLAGFSAGLFAGALSAMVYAVHCSESTASFVATWYSAGMLLPGLQGLAIGPRVFRW